MVPKPAFVFAICIIQAILQIEAVPLTDSSQPNLGIIGGFEAHPHTAVSEVYIVANLSFRQFPCSGNLISPNYVLTWADCVSIANNVTLHLGAHNVTEFGPDEIKTWSNEFIIHDTHDVALIKLRSPVKLNSKIGVANLPFKSDVGKTYAGQKAIVYGWGATGFRREGDDIQFIKSDVLRYAYMLVITEAECKKEMYSSFIEGSLCTSGEAFRSGCFGDYGGGLYVEGILVGLTQISDCLWYLDHPTAYVNIANALGWIEEHSDVVIR